MQCNSSQERSENMCEKWPCRYQGQSRKRGRSSPGTRAEVSLQAVVQLMEIHGGTEIHLQPMESSTL